MRAGVLAYSARQVWFGIAEAKSVRTLNGSRSGLGFRVPNFRASGFSSSIVPSTTRIGTDAPG